MRNDPNLAPRGERNIAKWFWLCILIVVLGFIVTSIVLNVIEDADERRIASERATQQVPIAATKTAVSRNNMATGQSFQATRTIALEATQTSARKKNATARADLATRAAQATPRPTYTPRPPTKGLGVSVSEVRRVLGEVGFEFNPIRNNRYQYGASDYHTANGSVAEVHLDFSDASNIRKAELKVYDVHIEPELGAGHMLLFLDVMLPDWKDAEIARWAADASNRIERGEVAKHRRSTSIGYAQIVMEARSTTIFVTVVAE